MCEHSPGQQLFPFLALRHTVGTLCFMRCRLVVEDPPPHGPQGARHTGGDLSVTTWPLR